MPIACATLMCHAPIVIPQIAGHRAADCAATTDAMRAAARALVAHEVDVCVLISPHAPRHLTRWGVAEADSLHGSFARFGHPELALSFRGAPDAARTLTACAAARGLETHDAAAHALDHGALVPLYFLHEAGYRGQVLLVALPYPDAGSEVTFGRAIRDAARATEARWAVLASGDMSHRLTPDAPSGFDPEAQQFDAQFVSRLRDGDLRGAISLPAALVARAGEDVVQSTAVAAGAVDFDAHGARVFSYEGPFGVGYCEALLYTRGAESARSAPAPDPETARPTHVATTSSSATPPRAIAELAYAAIARALGDDAPLELPQLPAPWDAPRAVFVTLRSPSGALRGCIGRTQPVTDDLVSEVIDCALGAALRDPRMPPVTRDELPTLMVEVSVLEPPEPIDDADALDPARYGVLVTHGTRRGVLLPNIDGIDSVALQLALALRKAGIDPDEPYRMQRFAVHKVSRRPR